MKASVIVNLIVTKEWGDIQFQNRDPVHKLLRGNQLWKSSSPTSNYQEVGVFYTPHPRTNRQQTVRSDHVGQSLTCWKYGKLDVSETGWSSSQMRESAIDWTRPHYQRAIDRPASCKLRRHKSSTEVYSNCQRPGGNPSKLVFSGTSQFQVQSLWMRKAVLWLGWWSLEVVGGVTLVYTFTLNDDQNHVRTS